jgi:hypothetical protein
MGLIIGHDCKLYYNTGTNASPTWNEIKIVGDVTLADLGAGDAEVNLRISDWVLNLPAKLRAAIEFNLANDIGGTDYDNLRGYCFARTIKQYAVVNGDINTSGKQYFKAFCHFNGFPWSQPIEEVTQHDSRLSLSYQEESGSLVEPAWATVP